MLTMAGFGLVNTMQANQKSDSEIASRTNLNRSLDFIADEIRMAKSIGVPGSSSVPTPTCGTATGVLDLTMPNNSHIIYYAHNMSACSSNIWSTPAAIRRVAAGSDTLLVDAVVAPSAAPGCTGTSAGGDGFYACIDSSSRTATLALYGKLTDPYGKTIGTYPVSSQVSARSF